MIRVVLDTNVVVSALLNPDGFEERVFKLSLHRFLQLCVSGPILAEYEAVLRRPKFSFDPTLVNHALEQIRKLSLVVKPKRTLAVSPHSSCLISLREFLRRIFLLSFPASRLVPR